MFFTEYINIVIDMKLRTFIRTLFFVIPVGAFAQYPGQIEKLTKVDVCVPLKAVAFNYSDVRLLG